MGEIGTAPAEVGDPARRARHSGTAAACSPTASASRTAARFKGAAVRRRLPAMKRWLLE